MIFRQDGEIFLGSAVILDPLFRQRIFDAANYATACDQLKEEFDTLEVPTIVLPSTSENSKRSKFDVDLYDFHDSMLGQAPQESSTQFVYDPDTEWSRSRAEPCLLPECDPDEWFFDRLDQYPRISSLYRKYNLELCNSSRL
jgi:hypothetical protein